jgi:hypothetical protein
MHVSAFVFPDNNASKRCLSGFVSPIPVWVLVWSYYYLVLLEHVTDCYGPPVSTIRVRGFGSLDFRSDGHLVSSSSVQTGCPFHDIATALSVPRRPAATPSSGLCDPGWRGFLLRYLCPDFAFFLPSRGAVMSRGRKAAAVRSWSERGNPSCGAAPEPRRSVRAASWCRTAGAFARARGEPAGQRARFLSSI